MCSQLMQANLFLSREFCGHGTAERDVRRGLGRRGSHGARKMGSMAIGIELLSSAGGRLAASSIILSQAIEPTDLDHAQLYIFGTFKSRPQVDRAFGLGENPAFDIEAYNFQLDQSTEKPGGEIKLGFADPGRFPTSCRPINRGVTPAGDHIYIARILQLNNMAKERYEPILSITDVMSGQPATARTTFEIR